MAGWTLRIKGAGLEAVLDEELRATAVSKPTACRILLSYRVPVHLPLIRRHLGSALQCFWACASSLLLLLVNRYFSTVRDTARLVVDPTLRLVNNPISKAA